MIITCTLVLKLGQISLSSILESVGDISCASNTLPAPSLVNNRLPAIFPVIWLVITTLLWLDETWRCELLLAKIWFRGTLCVGFAEDIIVVWLPMTILEFILSLRCCIADAIWRLELLLETCWTPVWFWPIILSFPIEFVGIWCCEICPELKAFCRILGGLLRARCSTLCVRFTVEKPLNVEDEFGLVGILTAGEVVDIRTWEDERVGWDWQVKTVFML